MRFTTAIVAAFTIASIGVQALPAPGEPTKADYKPVKPTPSSKPEPEYEIVCKEFAFFHGWDITCGDLPCGPTEGKWIYDCAKDCLENKDCDATVSYNGYCYPKTLDNFKVRAIAVLIGRVLNRADTVPSDAAQIENLVKKEGRDLAIEGCCEELEDNYKKTKCYPDGFLDCCYDKKICTKVYKKKEEPKKEEPKKEEPKKEEKKW
ncbi:hypothetical protein QFC19_004195 [Naganishia cerealis]|uniref:Uncharacterized protein n=1 Tax=Naganishia cerealis TaxID=610337 RepID=A0ACC2VXM3_9TREE|nr:hypothetical protein QFC19_004195 [Naganishia cerealis]